MIPFKFRVVLCRIQLFPILITNINWPGDVLPLKIFLSNILVIDPLEIDILPVYQIMDRGGKIMNKSQDPNFSKEDALHMYKTMMSVSNLLTSF